MSPIYTNDYDYPDALVRALIHDSYEKSGDYSATDLLKSVRQYYLVKRYWDHIKIDVSELIWLLLGKATHYMIEAANEGEKHIEQQFIYEYNGVTFSGRPDYSKKGVDDWKVTSAYRMKEPNADHEAQLNMYAFLLAEAGLPVDRLRIFGILKDWSVSKIKDLNYPQSAIAVISYPVWDKTRVQSFIHQGIDKLERYKNTPNNQLPYCTPDEMWESPERYAIMKKGAKRASLLVDTIFEAEEAAKKDSSYTIQVRPGRIGKCPYYCYARDFCNQWAKRSKELGNG